ncbi:hypothetical protein AGMMS49944_18830 [Spirochaetia bacterium]|nr:hypothetical protein AGMMS49944_18830 [Spirochaetia bacterium]
MTSSRKIVLLDRVKFAELRFIPDDEADVCVLPNTEAVGFSNVFPLYQDEVEFYRSTSIDNMVRKFGTLFKQPVTGERKNLCQGMLKLTAKK